MAPSFLNEQSSESLTQAALDTLPLNIAILDSNGEILGTNTAWQAFATANDLAMQPDTVGVNYLEVCDRANDPTATEAAAGIRDVIAGDRTLFKLEYPCHSPDEQRWFILRATKFSHDETPYISVAHIDITDRKQAELKAERTADQLADQQETLALLNQIVRHDIRNDANAITGWVTLLEDEVEGDVQGQLQRIHTAATQISELTTTAADLADTVTADASSDLQPTNLTATLQHELDKLQTTTGIHRKAVEIDHSQTPATDDVWVLADEMLPAVFSNILNNAIFHTQTEPVELTISVDRDATANTVTVQIADNGPGIPDSAKESVFGRGEKGLASDGTGLGLYLVDQLMTRYDGEVNLTDNTPTGTIVHLTFCHANPP